MTLYHFVISVLQSLQSTNALVNSAKTENSDDCSDAGKCGTVAACATE